MSLDGNVTRWLQQLKQGDRSAAQDLWQHYFAQLVRLAQKASVVPATHGPKGP